MSQADVLVVVAEGIGAKAPPSEREVTSSPLLMMVFRDVAHPFCAAALTLGLLAGRVSWVSEGAPDGPGPPATLWA